MKPYWLFHIMYLYDYIINNFTFLRAQWPLATHLYTAGLSAYLQNFNKV